MPSTLKAVHETAALLRTAFKPHPIEFETLTSAELTERIKAGSVDAFLASSGYYWRMRRYGVMAVGTLISPQQPDPNNATALTFLVRAGDSRFNELYDLKAEQLAPLPRLGEKSAENIIRSIRRSTEVPFRRVLFGLGIRFVGETTAKYLADHFRSLEAVMQASREELVEADEVGEKIADAILEYFADAENRRIIERLRRAGLQFEASARELASEALAGRSFVVSGRFSRSREEMKELIEQHGGRNLSAVSGNVDFLVAGEKMGPEKRKKAEKLGIRILSEEEFLRMLETGTEPQVKAPAAEAPSAVPAQQTIGESAADTPEPRQGELF